MIVMWIVAPLGRAQSVAYTVRLHDARSQVVEIEMLVRGWEAETMDVHLPAWRPGKYTILDPAATVRTITATNAAGTVLDVHQYAKASWRVSGSRGDVRVTYRLYANSLGDRTRHADDTHAFLSGSTVFLYVPELRDRPLTVDVETPGRWRVACGLERDGRVLKAASYDDLVDSPIEVGLHEFAERTVEGVRFEVAVWGATGWTDRAEGINLARVMDDIEKIAKEQIRLFGGFPASRYLFIVHVAPGIGGGTEHLNSTVCQTRPETFEDEKAYARFLSLLSHELFHTWNVKAFRPAGLVPYDYQKENYTTLLWVAEGITNYYDTLTLARTGQVREKDYLDQLSGTIRGEMDRPGGKVQSLEGSSFEAWTKFSRPSPDSANTTVDFYSRGEVTAFALDLAIRRASGGKASLDTVMRLMWERFPSATRAYTTADFMRAVHDAAGEDLSWFYEAHIRGTAMPDVAGLAGSVGLEFGTKTDEAKDDESKPKATRAYLGLRLRDEGGLAAVSGVLEDGPAFAAGVIADDVLLAVNGRRMRGTDLDARLKDLADGETVRLTFFRREELREVYLEPRWKPTAQPTLRKVAKPSEDQTAGFADWLGKGGKTP